ncbi:hypothetical protein ACP3WD_24685, partial [Salmonella enterica]|uniref:hypothetical protein n=1 Tax=Salmonella enterica TaxID=28901 RepID=UPI003CF0A15A
GKDKVTQTEATMGAEDFGLFAKAADVPNLFFWVGADDAKDKTIGNHSPKFAPRYKIVLPLAIRAMTAGLLEVQGSDTRVGER